MYRLVVSPLWCVLTLGIAQSLLAGTPPISTASAGQVATAIPLDQIGAVAGRQSSGDGLVVAFSADGVTTFSDDHWISMNPGVPGADGPVNAAVLDGSGNLYIGGLFTIVGNVVA